jgi:hypothetical protein
MVLGLVFLGLAILSSAILLMCAITDNSREVKKLRDEMIATNEHLSLTPLGPWLEERRSAYRASSQARDINHV